MGKSISVRFDEAKKWLKKNDEAGLNLKPAQAALASAEKISEELAKAKARVLELAAAKKDTLEVLSEALAKTKTEKKLKGKEVRLQSKLAALAAPPAASK